ncbi:MAG: DUF4097 family beta strand repeat protein [Rhodothermales bacterium]|nr:DUF4097 family beta strand repeat protein [Rhodothermales bacterium]
MNRRQLLNATRLMAIAIVIAVAGTTAVQASVEKDTIKRSFTVEPGGTLYIDVDRGNVVVEAIDGNQVHVEMERLVNRTNADDVKRILARHEWEIERDGSDVVIESQFEREGIRRARMEEFRLRVVVKVPHEYNVDFSTGAGNVDIANLRGYVEGRTGAGNVTIGEILGDVEVRSGSGNIEIAGVDGELEVQSGAGNIRLGYVGGEIDAATGAGDITARITRQPGADSRLESGAGNVVVYVEQGIGLLVDAKASVGSASCEFDLEVEGRWMSKSFGGRINGGGPELTMRSGVGNVSLRRF